MGSITKLLDESTRQIVDENAHKIGFSKAFDELNVLIQPKPRKYNTRNVQNEPLNPQQRHMKSLSDIFNLAISKRLASKEKKIHMKKNLIAAQPPDAKAISKQELEKEEKSKSMQQKRFASKKKHVARAKKSKCCESTRRSKRLAMKAN